MSRVRQLHTAAPSPGARYVLYWMQMNRRPEANHALEFAISRANALNLPLLVYEAVTFDYPFASDRFHTFLLEGVPATARSLRARGAGYLFYLRRSPSDPNNVLYRLCRDAAEAVTDDYPVFLARRYNSTVPARAGIPFFAVDASAVVPLGLIETKQYAAYTIRPRIRKLLEAHLRPTAEPPLARPWQGPLPCGDLHTEVRPDNLASLVASCAIDHSVAPSTAFRGGRIEAQLRLEQFVTGPLARYSLDRNQPAAHATSNLSPYLHFGHLGALETALAAPDESFREELIVRRELAFNHARFSPDPASLDTIPAWALKTLRQHAADRRDPVYTRAQFELAQTHDTLWNATQTELRLRGKIHGYYRMYWGKKIIEWSPSPEEALATMLYLNDRWALDGRDPNTYTNILWCFGLHDRPWGERPIFGMVRYLSLDGMKRKTNVDAYLREIAAIAATGADPLRLQSGSA